RHPTLRPDHMMDRLEVDHGVLQRDDEEEPALLVLQKQILAVAAGDTLVKVGRLGDGEDRLVLVRRGLDPQAYQEGKQVVAGGRHRSLSFGACSGSDPARQGVVARRAQYSAYRSRQDLSSVTEKRRGGIARPAARPLQGPS